MSIDYRIERWNKPHHPNRAMLWFIMESEGYQVFQWSERPDMFFPKKANEEDRCFWVVSGAIERTVNNVGTFILRAGDREFMPANVWHWGRVISEEPLLYMVGKKIKPAKTEEKVMEEVLQTQPQIETVKEKKPGKPREKKVKTTKPKPLKKK